MEIKKTTPIKSKTNKNSFNLRVISIIEHIVNHCTNQNQKNDTKNLTKLSVFYISLFNAPNFANLNVNTHNNETNKKKHTHTHKHRNCFNFWYHFFDSDWCND